MPPVTELKELPTPNDFYETYVKLREPVVFRSCLSHFSPKLSGLTLKDLSSMAGTCSIEVNESNSGSFSPADSTVKTVSFSEFLEDLLPKGKHYMTTQTLPTDDEGRPAIYASPIQELVEHDILQLRPTLWGNLIPMTYNLWIGNSTTASSSGLHHDYHDNLYCLVKGTKTFRLAPPHAVQKVTMQGTLHTLHSNGRIVYKEQIDDGEGIRPDGALEGVDRLVELEVRKESIEKQISRAGDDTTREALENDLNEVEEEILDYEMGKQNDASDDDEGCVLFGGQGDGESGQGSADYASSDGDDPRPTKKTKTEATVPANFCIQEPTNVDFNTISIQEGDILYLPAGWFHEVQSKGGVHMALNYWMHPVDVGPDVSFEKPYRSQFWARDWSSRGQL